MVFTTAQVIEIVGISRRTLQNWLKEGKIEKEKGQGRKKIWTADEVKQLMRIKHGLADEAGGSLVRLGG